MAAENFKVKKGLEVGTGTTINATGIKVTGIITATQLVGDGSGLTGVVGSGSGVVIKDEGSAVGTAGTINFVGSGVDATLSEGTATVTVGINTANIVTDTLNVSGVSTFTNEIVIRDNSPTITFDQTSGNLNTNQYRIREASGELVVQVSHNNGASYTNGVSIGGIGNIFIPDNDKVFFGTHDDAYIQHDNSNLNVINTTGNIDVTGNVALNNDLDVDGLTNLDDVIITGFTTFAAGTKFFNHTPRIEMQGNNTAILSFVNATTGTTTGDGMLMGFSSSSQVGFINVNEPSHGFILKVGGSHTSAERINISGVGTVSIRKGTTEEMITARPDGAVELYFDGNQKLTTTGTGIEVPDLSVTGVGTIGRVDVNGLVFGTNATTFAAKFPDNAVINVGTGNDLQISHANDVSLIRDTRAGAGATLAIGADKLFLRNKDGNENYLEATDNGSVKLFYDFAPKFETDQAGVKITGVCTATSFSGSAAGLTNIPSAQLSGALPSLDGSALTGVTASGTGIVIQHDGSNVGTAGTINFSTNLDVSPIHAGIVTVTASGGSGISTANVVTDTLNVSGISTFDGRVLVGTTTEGHPSADDLTIATSGDTGITIRSGTSSFGHIYFSDGTSGGAELAGAIEYFHHHNYMQFRAGGGARLRITSDGKMSLGTSLHATPAAALHIDHDSNDLLMLDNSTKDTQKMLFASNEETHAQIYATSATGALTIESDPSNNHSNSFIDFRVDGSERFRINEDGVDVSGIATATTFSGSGASLTTLNASELDSGTIPNGRFPATLPAVSGVNLTALNASEITSGTLPIARIDDNAVTFAKMQDVGTGVFIGRNDSGSGDIETLTAAEARTLLNVEDGATADQTAAEIRTLVENASDSNVFTDADHSKLDGIAAGATAGITTAPSNIVATWSISGGSGSGYQFTGPGQDGSEGNPDIYLVRGQRYRFINTTGSSHPFEFRNSANNADYTDGITGSQNGTQDFNVQHDAPTALKYRCTIHTGSMQGNIYIVGQYLQNGADNRVITATNAYQMLGEQALIFDGARLGIGLTPSGIALDISKNTQGGIRITDTAVTDASYEIRTQTGNSTKMFRLYDVAAGEDKFQISSAGQVKVTETTNTSSTTTGAFVVSGGVGIAKDVFVGGDMTVQHSGLAVNIFESNDNHSRLRIRSSDSSLAQLEFADQTDADAGEIRYDHANDKMTFHVYDNTERLGITSEGQLLVGSHTSPHNSYYKIDIQADTTTHLHGVSVRATALQNDTFCIAALAHATPSGAATNRRAHIGVYRNGSSQPGGYVYMHQQDGGHTYIWPDSSNVLRISNAVSNLTNDAGGIVGTQTSDIRLKNVLGDVTYGLAEINKINPIQFNFKNDKNVQKRIGFSAQDLQSIIPESVYNTKNTAEIDGVEIEDVLGMEYVQITPVLVNAVKELSTEIDKLKAEIAALKSS